MFSLHRLKDPNELFQMIQKYIAKRSLQTRSSDRKLSQERRNMLNEKMFNKIRIGAFKTTRRRNYPIPEANEDIELTEKDDRMSESFHSENSVPEIRYYSSNFNLA